MPTRIVEVVGERRVTIAGAVRPAVKTALLDCAERSGLSMSRTLDIMLGALFGVDDDTTPASDILMGVLAASHLYRAAVEHPDRVQEIVLEIDRIVSRWRAAS